MEGGEKAMTLTVRRAQVQQLLARMCAIGCCSMKASTTSMGMVRLHDIQTNCEDSQ